MKEVWLGREAHAKGHVSSMCNNNNKNYIKKIKRIHDKKSLKTVKLRKKEWQGHQVSSGGRVVALGLDFKIKA